MTDSGTIIFMTLIIVSLLVALAFYLTYPIRINHKLNELEKEVTRIKYEYGQRLFVIENINKITYETFERIKKEKE